MPRKTLSVWEREHKKQFEQELKQYSLTALKNVMRIADRSLDERVRLQANQYILDKVLGKNFVLFSELEQQNKELAKAKFSQIRTQTKEIRQSRKAVNSYYQNMMKMNTVDPQFMDSKKQNMK